MSYSRWIDSDWYIFWYSSGYDNDIKEDQALAIWKSIDESPTLGYNQVKDLYERDAWEEIFNGVPQRDLLNSCVQTWLERVEEECD